MPFQSVCHSDLWKGCAEVLLHAFLTSALDGNECSDRTIPKENCCTHCVGGRTGLDSCDE